MTFDKRLKELRKRSGKTQAEMAEELGIKRSTYGAYERGTIQPTGGRLHGLAGSFGVSVDWLMGREAALGAPDGDVLAALAMLADWARTEPGLNADGRELDALGRAAAVAAIEGAAHFLGAFANR